MIAIQDVLISDDIVQEAFICDLKSCKGACCWKGDFGAPVDLDEQNTIDQILPKVSPFLSQASLELLAAKGPFADYDDDSFTGTALHKSGACIFMTTTSSGQAQCGFQQAFINDHVDFEKPLSCHLYPIRVTKNKASGFEAWNYDKWEICSAACSLGKKEKVYIYQFLKDPIIRAKGNSFYEELDAAAKHLNGTT